MKLQVLLARLRCGIRACRALTVEGRWGSRVESNRNLWVEFVSAWKLGFDSGLMKCGRMLSSVISATAHGFNINRPFWLLQLSEGICGHAANSGSHLASAGASVDDDMTPEQDAELLARTENVKYWWKDVPFGPAPSRDDLEEHAALFIANVTNLTFLVPSYS